MALEASHILDNNTAPPWFGPPPPAVLEPLTTSLVPEEDPWPMFGAKPKRICSTPSPLEPWITVQGDKKRNTFVSLSGNVTAFRVSKDS
ncbi:hypothetical protein COCON_G00033670 [Conger conger]|uniref:Uncharacterized protein n=1 Tax=Conger conger TaxID=82655 RepID=A0A9Q1I5M3_CONCO|nr:hypothetical protein COCON_G00033670 [Conger conger]